MMRYIEERESDMKREREMLEASHKDFIAVMVEKHKLEQERLLVSYPCMHAVITPVNKYSHLP